jgi:hypothetical protein
VIRNDDPTQEGEPMKIRMPISFHGNYLVQIRLGEEESRERCQKLTVRELSTEERAQSFPGMPEDRMPTHQITFYDFGCKRVIEGKITANEESRIAFAVRDKEYIFSPFRPRSA